MPTNPRLWLHIRANAMLTNFGNGLTGAILVFYLLDVTSQHGIVLPLFFLSLGLSLSVAFLAPLVDRIARPRIAWVSELCRMIATAALAFGHNYILICTAFFINGIMACLYRPAVSAIWAQLTNDVAQRSQVFATNAMLSRIGLALGGGLGGVIVTQHSYRCGFAIDVVTFLCSALFWAYVDRKHQELHGVHDHGESMRTLLGNALRIDRSFQQSWAVIAQVRWLSAYVLVGIIAAVPLQIVSTSAPIVMVDTFSPAVLGLWAALPSWLLLLGNIITRLVKNIPIPGFFLAGSQVLMAVSYIFAMFHPLIWFALVFMSLGRVTNALAQPVFNAWVASHFPAEQRGKAFAFAADANLMLGPLGLLLAYPIIAAFPAQHVTIVMAAGAAICYLIPLLIPGFIQLKAQKITEEET
ncbi:MFS transporter [Corynebacterium sp. sy017]|uniref:MFS transporter n=1 Tax=unclassified Corynebacterium TaxID=2624378 RepID=UPI00118477A4|nr:MULTISPECIES: MFS transporter [unclassified Corynebacterium]MBP3089300.1 MFS transporter [Corynebacterium sp. sy017]QDZ43238.1 MFS transporter [Corynebacterium sp. sy039]TSD90999.1 MFS transporter [Corynebacterium sp. SY003]